MLTLDTKTPVVTETTVGPNLLQPLEILTKLAVETVGHNLVVLSVDDVALSVQEPRRDLVLGRVLEDGDDTLELFGGEFTGAGEVSSRIPSFSHHPPFSSLRSTRVLWIKTYRFVRSTSAFLHTRLE